MRASEALIPFGFTALEAEVYAFLVRDHPATGYRIAHAIGKPAANTYKAIQSLERKGAIMVDVTANRSCIPVAPEVLLDRVNRRFEADRVGALKVLQEAVAPVSTGRAFPVGTTGAALGAARLLLGSAKEAVLLHAAPDHLQALAPDLATAAGVAQIYILGPETEAIPGAEWLAMRGEVGNVLELAVDGTSGLLAAGDGGGELAGMAATDHPFGAQAHRLLAHYMAVAELAQGLADNISRKQLARILEGLD